MLYSHAKVESFLKKNGMIKDEIYSHKDTTWMFLTKKDLDNDNVHIVLSRYLSTSQIEITYKPGDDPADTWAAKGYKVCETQKEAINHIKAQGWLR
jgi:hypothetical protein